MEEVSEASSGRCTAPGIGNALSSPVEEVGASEEEDDEEKEEEDDDAMLSSSDDAALACAWFCAGWDG